MRAAESSVVLEMLNTCPFLEGLFDLDDGPTVIFGGVARLIRQRRLSQDEEDSIFLYWNALAERGDEAELTILGTGALESFNDDAASQRLARGKLKGKALQMLEEFRRAWGQPDFGMNEVK